MNATSVPELYVVHSSVGRLRVHLPDPDGHITARLRLVPGVTYAEANEWTGNILILFNPRQTNEAALLAELGAPRVEAPAVVLPASSHALVPALVELVAPVNYVTGTWATVYKALGWTSVGLAVVGAITPGIPTVPFVILAGYFFIRSSPPAHEWLKQSKWFGPMLRDWEEQRAVKRSLKYTTYGLMGAGLTISWLIGLPAPVLATILVLEIIGAIIVLRLPEVEELPALPVPAPV